MFESKNWCSCTMINQPAVWMSLDIILSLLNHRCCSSGMGIQSTWLHILLHTPDHNNDEVNKIRHGIQRKFWMVLLNHKGIKITNIKIRNYLVSLWICGVVQVSEGLQNKLMSSCLVSIYHYTCEIILLNSVIWKFEKTKS